MAADLASLSGRALDHALLTAAERGCVVVGICGGFQMLGTRLTDPHGLEGKAGSEIRGLGLLPLETTLAEQKTLVRKQGIHTPSGQPVHGYEIHHGVSRGTEACLLCFEDGSSCGAAAADAAVWGSYLHGIFDSDGFRRWFINDLRRRKGLAEFQGQGACYDLEPALDRLARALRDALDMDAVYRLLDL